MNSQDRAAARRFARGRCEAVTGMGRQCRRMAAAGERVCHIHAGRGRPQAGDERRCTAMVVERRCKGWALRGSKPPLCYSHARSSVRGRRAVGSLRRCEARTTQGRRCSNWAMAEPASNVGGGRKGRSERNLCVVHAGVTPRPGREVDYAGARAPESAPVALEWQRVGCSARTARGERCRAWAMRHSDPPLCQAHSRPSGYRPPGRKDQERGRQCSARTLSGARCRRWVQRKPAGPGGAPLCWIHDKANRPGRLRHGYYRRTSPFTPAQEAAIAAIKRSEAPLTAELLLVRLKLRGVMLYLKEHGLHPDQRLRTTRLAMDGVNTVGRLVEMRRAADRDEIWAPSAGGGVFYMLQGILREADEPDVESEDGREGANFFGTRLKEE